MKPVPTLRRLTPADAESYRAIRLEGLRSHPEAFGAAWEEEAGQPLPWFAERLERNAVFGGWLEGPILAGVAGLLVPEAAKLRHKGVLWGMFIRPAARGSGLAAALVQRVIEAAAHTVEELRLTVVASNTAAVRLYTHRDTHRGFRDTHRGFRDTHRGFREYGVEPRALKVGGRYHDEVLMALPLRNPDGMRAAGVRTRPT